MIVRMRIIPIIFCIIIFIIGYIQEPRKLNPVTVFCGEWAIIVFLSVLGLYNILEVSDVTYFYIFLGCIGFTLGFYGGKGNKIRFKTKISYKKLAQGYSFVLNYTLVYVLITLTLAFYFFESISSIGLLLQGNTLALIRVQAQEGIQYNTNPFINAFRILIASPMSIALCPIAAQEFFKKTNRNKYIIIGPAGICLLKTISDGSRGSFIFLAFSFLVCFMYNSQSGNVKKAMSHFVSSRLKIRTLFFYTLALAGVVFLFVVTISRTGSNTVRFTYYYFAMEPLMFEKFAKIVDSNNLYGLGMASFNGLLFPMFYIICNFLQISYPAYWRRVYDMLESAGTNWQVITTKGLTANSYTTAFWNLYLDGRILGIFFGMFIYGIFVGTCYKNVLQNQNEKTLSIFCLVMYGVFSSFQFIMFENMYFAISFVCLSFLCYKRIRIK